MRFTSMHAAALMAAMMVPSFASAQTQTYEVISSGGSRAMFESDAPLETINGVSSRVTGSVTVDPNNLSTTRGTISVPVASIRTGNDTRDEHLRGDDWLDAANHPNATFEITGASGATALVPNEQVRVRLRGRFTIHGVSRNMTINARVRLVPGTGDGPDQVRVRARFTVRLTNHNISVPTAVRAMVSDDIVVRVSLRMRPRG